jgi:hypothetical protein
MYWIRSIFRYESSMLCKRLRAGLTLQQKIASLSLADTIERVRCRPRHGQVRRALDLIAETVATLDAITRQLRRRHPAALETSANSKHMCADSPILVAVGTRITARPPHRTVLAAFPHTAPTSGA